MRNRVIVICSIIAGVLVLGALFVWGGTIKNITITGEFVTEPDLSIKASECVSKYIDNSLWFLSEKAVNESIQKCNVMFKGAILRNHFPRTLEVVISTVKPIFKIEQKDKSCKIVGEGESLVDLPVERCAQYMLPIATGVDIEGNSYVLDYIRILVNSLEAKSLQAKKIEYRGDVVAQWYIVTLSPGTIVYLPSGVNGKEKVDILAAAIKGLNNAKERYSVIDLRFDRVVYK